MCRTCASNTEVEKEEEEQEEFFGGNSHAKRKKNLGNYRFKIEAWKVWIPLCEKC